MIIDFHCHFTPKELVEKHGGAGTMTYYAGAPVSIFQPKMYQTQHHIEAMDLVGIDTAVLSSQAALWAPLAECIFTNDAIADLTVRYPGRFLGLAHVPPLGGDAALRELERCVRELGCVGAAMSSNVGDIAVDSPQLWPFLELVSDLGIYLFIHSASRPLADQRLDEHDMLRSVGREFGLCMAVIRLINGGVLDRFPQLRVQVAHLGGALPSLLPRIRKYQDKDLWGTRGDPVMGRVPEQPFDELLDRIYFDTGGAVSVRAGLTELNPERCVLGTDYPLDFTTPQELQAFVDGIRLSLPPEPVRAILSGNARSLLGPRAG